LPDDQVESAEAVDLVEVVAVARDERRPDGTRGQGDERVEMKVANLADVVALLRFQCAENLTASAPFRDTGEEHAVI
jgi:hypothetical protein